MFGNSRPKAQKPANEFDINNLDELLNSTLNENDEDLDMNDPELLKQLQELSSVSESSTKKSKALPRKPTAQPIQDMDIDFDSYAALANGNDEDIHVELNEDDYSDPHLLSQLSSLSQHNVKQTVLAEPSTEAQQVMDMGFTQRQAQKALDMFDNNPERAVNYLFDTADTREDETEDEVMETPYDVPAATTTESIVDEAEEADGEYKEEEEEQESTDPNFWEQKAKEYQQMALIAKKNGDKKKAVALLRESKISKQKYQDLMELHQPAEEEPADKPTMFFSDQSATHIEDSTPHESSPVSTLDKETSPLINTPSALSQPPQQTSPDPQQAQKLLEKIIALQKQYKAAALHYKGLGNVAAAKQMVQASKNLLRTGVGLRDGEIVNLSQVKLPSEPDMSLGDGKIRHVSEVDRDANPTSYKKIESQLTYQMNICHNLSIQNMLSRKGKSSRAGSKTLAGTDQNGDMYGAVEQAIAADITSLASSKNNTAEAIIPPLHYEQVNYTYKNIIDTIPENMMELKIVRAISLPTLDISTDLAPFVTWDFGGWPPENTDQAKLNKGETPANTGANPEFAFTQLIPITRADKRLERYVQRKKLTIEVLHNKYTYGFFRKPTSLGKVTIPMDRLLTKSSISETFDLLDTGRKKTGGKIEIQVNLRDPVQGEDVAKRAERWLVLDSFGSTVSECLSIAGMTTGGPVRPTTSYVEPVPHSAITESKANQPKTPVATSNTPTTQEADVLVSTPTKPKQEGEKKVMPVKQQPEPLNDTESELEKAEAELNDVDKLVSNMVMEHEMNLLNTGLASKQPDKSKEELMDRKQAITIKMNMLEIQVQTGLLDMDTYLANVEKRMDGDYRLAITFKKHGRLDLAKVALVRKKIMQEEVTEARAAMAEQGE